MKIFTSTNEYSAMPKDIREHLEEALQGERGLFDVLLGGDAYLLEQVEELDQIVVDFENGGTAVDTVAPMDNAELLGDFAVFFMATNDAGGNVYFTPRWMVDNCIILQSIIRATEGEHQRCRDVNGQ